MGGRAGGKRGAPPREGKAARATQGGREDEGREVALGRGVLHESRARVHAMTCRIHARSVHL